MTDEELIHQIAWDPEGGIREVIDRYGPQLLGRLRMHAHDKRYGDAFVEEVFQRALLRLLKPEFRRELVAAGGEILPWLSRWGYWRLDDLARRQAVGAEKASGLLDSTRSTAPSTAGMLVQSVFSQLSPRDRLVLRLRYNESMSNAELGEILGLTENAAKKAAHDARERLRKLLEKAGIRYE